MINNQTEKILLSVLVLLLVTSGVLGYFFFRDMGIKLSSSGEEGLSCVPTNFNVSDLDKSSFNLSWKTEGECIGYIIYGDAIDDTDKLATPSYGFEKREEQSVAVSGLNPDTTYYLYIVSGDEIYGEGGKVIHISTLEY